MPVRSYAQLADQIRDSLADNQAGDISEGDVRSVFTNLIDSLAFATAIRTAATYAAATVAIDAGTILVLDDFIPAMPAVPPANLVLMFTIPAAWVGTGSSEFGDEAQIRIGAQVFNIVRLGGGHVLHEELRGGQRLMLARIGVVGDNDLIIVSEYTTPRSLRLDQLVSGTAGRLFGFGADGRPREVRLTAGAGIAIAPINADGEIEITAGAVAPSDHTRYAAAKQAAGAFTAAEFLAGVASQAARTGTPDVADDAAQWRLAFAVAVSGGRAVAIEQVGGLGGNLRAEFAPAVGAADVELAIAGVPHYVYTYEATVIGALLGAVHEWDITQG